MITSLFGRWLAFFLDDDLHVLFDDLQFFDDNFHFLVDDINFFFLNIDLHLVE